MIGSFIFLIFTGNAPTMIRYCSLVNEDILPRMCFIAVYSSRSIPNSDDGWTKPVGWTGPVPILYWSLDNLQGLVLMEGTQQKEYDALTEGKVGHYIDALSAV